MLSLEDLVDLTDPVTLARGRAYARQARVESLRSAGGELHAEVVGSQTYHVRIGDGTWSCDCPIGIAGAACKHCVAVVVVAESDAATDTGSGLSEDGAPLDDDPADAWLESLDAADLRDLLRDAVDEVPGVADLVARAYIAGTDDVVALRAEVEDAFTARRRFYEYRQAIRYADEAEPVVQLLVDRASRPSLELLGVVERALTLAVRTLLRSDDSSGAQSDQVRRLLDVHADVADGLADTLDDKARRRLARRLHGFMFSGKQVDFEVDVDAYAQALGAVGAAEYRGLVDRSAEALGEAAFSVRYARGRLAVLDRDPAAIISVLGEGLTTQHHVIRVVEALDDAGLTELAVEHATRGLTLPHSPRADALVQRLVDDAAARGDTRRVIALRRDAFTRDPSSATLGSYRAAAETAGAWEVEARAAEELVATTRPWEWIGVLLREGRNDEAWAFAVEHPDAASGQWALLCARRAETSPAETLPHYRRMVTEALATTGRRSYLAAAQLLVRLRSTSAAAGATTQFVEFLTATVEANRRRPTCIDELVRAGLIRGDRSVVTG